MLQIAGAVQRQRNILGSGQVAGSVLGAGGGLGTVAEWSARGAHGG
ncbi:hypothetical protein [Streptantibioticus rubrisoli]|uniref:Uncharacterized protein n=1 Tax=Streptantibioticus rubrisoli TaxID=1387313 RepID=A0ABT1PKD2_9ACTN|nr:hypothetical protein [Streptantibioticus rubrisoli]MCQ4045829.1 hypothetical protein [Streptantibioticus rubrisoli]